MTVRASRVIDIVGTRADRRSCSFSFPIPGGSFSFSFSLRHASRPVRLLSVRPSLYRQFRENPLVRKRTSANLALVASPVNVLSRGWTFRARDDREKPRTQSVVPASSNRAKNCKLRRPDAIEIVLLLRDTPPSIRKHAVLRSLTLRL